MLDCLNDMGFRQNNGRELTTNSIQPIQRELINKGLLLKSTRGISCPDSIRKEALRVNNPFSWKIMAIIHPEIRMEVALSLLERVSELLEPATDIFSYIINTYHAEIIGKRTAMRLINFHLLRGDKSLAHTFAENLEEELKPEQLSRTAWLETISGDHQKANKLFEQSIQCIKKRTGKRKLFLQNYAGIFHLLSLLGDCGSTALEKALGYIDIAKKNQYPLSIMTQT